MKISQVTKLKGKSFSEYLKEKSTFKAVQNIAKKIVYLFKFVDLSDEEVAIATCHLGVCYMYHLLCTYTHTHKHTMSS